MLAFPLPGLGIRVIGDIAKKRQYLLREADAIALEKMTEAGMEGI